MESQREESSNPVTLKIIMLGKEVGSIIGKKGEIVKRFREESGAKINISDSSCPERIVTVSGPIQALYKAFSLICSKIEEFQDIQNANASNGQKFPITLRLLLQASQCGCLIGKGGSKIKEIRELTGAAIQVASDMLPNSTERAVLITGTKDSITQCIYHICSVVLESPPKGPNIPYRPKPLLHQAPLLVTPGNQGFQTYAFQGFTPVTAAANGSADIGKIGPPLTSLTALGVGGMTSTNPTFAPTLSNIHGNPLHGRTHDVIREMTVPNDLIGCVIGKGGTKIAEIRQLSGAVIRISNCEDRENFENVDRTITITGSPEAVAFAQYLINIRISLETSGMSVPAYQYISPNHIVKTKSQ